MKQIICTSIAGAASILALNSGFAFAGEGAPMTPEMAAKKEMVSRQQEQRVTDKKRKSAAEALRAERVKVYKAKKALKHHDPSIVEKDHK